jgi:hypothetical protein
MLRLNAKQILEKSIKSGINMKFTDFIKFNSIDLNESYVDTFFHNLQSDIPIYMSENMIEYFGYKGSPKVQKELLNRLINENFLEYKNELYFDYDNKTYVEFRKEKEEILKTLESGVKKIDELYPLKTGKNMSKVKHILITPKLFKEMLMLCNTEKGKQVRRYYLDIVDVMELYVQFQNKLTITTLEQKLDYTNVQLTITNKELIEERKCAVEERKKADEERKKAEERFQEAQKKADEERKKADERFNKLLGVAEDTKEEVLEKIGELAETRLDLSNVVHDRVSTKRVPANKISYFVILKDADDEKVPYYVLRAQRQSVSRKITEMQKDYNVHEVFRIYEPNAVNFWISVCDKFSSNIRKSPTQNWFALRNISFLNFKKLMLEMDKSERQNPKFI